jgi:hypothetical protein
MPWQEMRHLSSASSASGAPSKEGALAMSSYAANPDLEDDDLKAEVQQLLLQYQLDSDRPNLSKISLQKPTEASGQELTSNSAFIHVENPATQKA